MTSFVSRAGEKLQAALSAFKIDASGLICADFGSSTGGFVDCLLQAGASKVYSVDTAYGELAWKIRKDPLVVVMERTNAMHVTLPEKADLITIDVAWTKQRLIIPNALANLKAGGHIVSLIKPHYEAEERLLHKGKLEAEQIDRVVTGVVNQIEGLEAKVVGLIESPILGEKRGNKEFLALIEANSS